MMTICGFACSDMIELGPKVLFLTISSAKSALRDVIVIVAYFRLHQLSAIAQDMRCGQRRSGLSAVDIPPDLPKHPFHAGLVVDFAVDMSIFAHQ
jgi:hypothetical protein